MKLRLSGWWTDSGPLNDRIIKQFIPPQERHSVEFVTDDSYDYLVVFGRLKSDLEIKDKSKTIFFSQEPLWSPNESRDPSEFAQTCIIADKRAYQNPEKLEETLLPMFYAGHNESHHTEQFDWSVELKEKDFSEQKSKGISYIVRKDYCSYWDSYVNKEISKLIYKNRTDLGARISNEISSVTIAGMNWQENGQNVLGNIWNKRVALNNYRFSICSENTIQQNYISEKFWDVVLIDAVPIYMGCSNINDYISDDYFINITKDCDDYDTMIELIRDIDNNQEELYKKYISKVKELKNIFFTDKRFNLWLKIKDLINF